jgi:hypothetical protein
MTDYPFLEDEISTRDIAGAPPGMLPALQSECSARDVLGFSLPAPIGMAFIVTVYFAAYRYVSPCANGLSAMGSASAVKSDILQS